LEDWSMLSKFFGHLGARRTAATKSSARRAAAARLRFRPTLLNLEARDVPSATLTAPQLGPARMATPISQIGSIAPLQINSISSVVNQAGQLVATGALGGTPFQAPLGITATPNAADPTCPILNLHLGEIHLNLLGLHVDTSEICLAVTAVPGPGNLLGNLLCNVANLLNGGTPLGTVLGGLSATDLGALTGEITGLLNGTLSTVTTPLSTSTSAVNADAVTNVLNLSVGPVNLNLLGLNVKLDNCHNGPVTVDITAVPGPGNLLGNLIGGLAGLLDRPGQRVGQLGHLLQDIGNVIGGLI